MNEKSGTTPGSTDEKNPASTSPSSQGASQTSASTPAKRGRKSGDSASRGKPRKDINELKFETIRILSNLPEEGRFFFTSEAPDGVKETINCWD